MKNDNYDSDLAGYLDDIGRFSRKLNVMSWLLRSAAEEVVKPPLEGIKLIDALHLALDVMDDQAVQVNRHAATAREIIHLRGRAS